MLELQPHYSTSTLRASSDFVVSIIEDVRSPILSACSIGYLESARLQPPPSLIFLQVHLCFIISPCDRKTAHASRRSLNVLVQRPVTSCIFAITSSPGIALKPRVSKAQGTSLLTRICLYCVALETPLCAICLTMTARWDASTKGVSFTELLQSVVSICFCSTCIPFPFSPFHSVRSVVAITLLSHIR